MRPFSVLLAGLLLSGTALAYGSDLDEFKIKRQEVFEFAEKPRLARSGDRVDLAFESKGYCDVTVAIENTEGKIVRHLASGVLGSNAPDPFQKNSLKQNLVWDGKDDQGHYIDAKESHSVRISLGLRPRYERSLYWEPRKRISRELQFASAAPEGVYVYDGFGVDHVSLFDHAGAYVRTLYPFSADKVEQVVGLDWHTFPQDNQKVPLRKGFYQATLLTSGTSCMRIVCHGPEGMAATALAASPLEGRLALAHLFLNRLSADGSTGGLPLLGPRTSSTQTYGGGMNFKLIQDEVSPKSAAFSPDGKWLYLAGYTWDRFRGDTRFGAWWHGLHGVVRLAYTESAEPKVFAGSMKAEEFGTENGRFRCATSVACDAQGRVYVSDYMNDRIQVFAPDGKFLKAVPVSKPAQVAVHQKTGELYVFSWPMPNQFSGDNQPSQVTRLGPLDDPKPRAAYPLPMAGYRYQDAAGPLGLKAKGCDTWRAALDSWTDPPTLWLVPGTPSSFESWEQTGLRLLAEKDGKLVVLKDFAQEAKRSITKLDPPHFGRQRLFVNPKDGKLYLGEQREGFCLDQLLQIDPQTGQANLIALPFSAEDVAFDMDGLIYLRGETEVGRYDPATWREVPWDYGEERDRAGFAGDGSRKLTPLISGLPITTGNWHKGGMSISPTGHLAVTCYYNESAMAERTAEKRTSGAKAYAARIYPGRNTWHKCPVVHVWDSHGKMIQEDALPGLGLMRSIGIDKDDALYFFGNGLRILDGKPYDNRATMTLMKFQPHTGRLLTSFKTPIPLTEEARPKTAPPIWMSNGGGLFPTWVEGALWMYGGLGYEANSLPNGGCTCFDSRCALDYFGRSVVPEIDHYSVGVLDTNGNLILRVGRYGNADDGKPLVAEGASPAARSIGGDEVALFYVPQLATHTDRRLFLADLGNARIASVKLDYHATERIALKDIADQSKAKP